MPALTWPSSSLAREVRAGPDPGGPARLVMQEEFLPAGARCSTAGTHSANLYLIRRGGVRISVASTAANPCAWRLGRGTSSATWPFSDRSPRSRTRCHGRHRSLRHLARPLDEVVRAQPLSASRSSLGWRACWARACANRCRTARPAGRVTNQSTRGQRGGREAVTRFLVD